MSNFEINVLGIEDINIKTIFDIRTNFDITTLEIKEKNIFIGWSGDQSKKIAESLVEWIPKVIKAAKPWVSFRDIKGNWSKDLEKIKRFKLGIFCMTKENLKSLWIQYEAGNIRDYVFPYLIDVNISDIEGPLAQFQCHEATEKDTLILMRHICLLLEEDIEDQQFKITFDQYWPYLKEVLNSSKCSTANIRTSYGHIVSNTSTITVLDPPDETKI